MHDLVVIVQKPITGVLFLVGGRRPKKPGNAGGGKGPHFECAFEAAEEKVLGV
jgi:hypothetical protein